MKMIYKKKICIFTDSQYSIYIFTGTGERYEKNGYKNNGVDVPNIDLIKKILEIKKSYNIVLLKVRAHTDKQDKHSIGNKIADKLANDGALDNSEENVFNKLSNVFVKSNYIDNNEEIDKNIQMNELFEFDELTEINNILPKKNSKKILKNPKLSNWFIKTS